MFILITLYIMILIWLFITYEDDDILIVTSHWKEDLNWLSGRNVVVCQKEGSDYHKLTTYKKYTCPVTINAGNESTAYLNFIVHNYDNLPKYIAFIHGHESAWHQGDIFDIIKNEEYKYKDYVSLNITGIHPPPPAALEWITNNWDTYFKDSLGSTPTDFSTQTCSQFITTRNSLKRISLKTYKNWLKLVLDVTLTNPGKELDIGNVFEYLWPKICTDRAKSRY